MRLVGWLVGRLAGRLVGVLGGRIVFVSRIGRIDLGLLAGFVEDCNDCSRIRRIDLGLV